MEHPINHDIYIVAGATGRCGRYIAKSLLNKNKRTILLIRNENKLKEIFKLEEISKFEKIICCDLAKDLDYSTKLEEMLNIDDANYYVISALSYRFESTQTCEEGNLITNKRLMDASVKSGKVKKFCLLSSSHVRRPYSYISLTCNINRRYMQYYKVLVEDYLRSSGLEYLIIRPTGLVMEENPTGFIICQGDKIEGKIHVSTVGRLTVDTLLDPWIPSNASYECLSTVEQMKTPLPYQYIQGNYHLRPETELERKYIDHLVPCRIVKVSFFLLIVGFSYLFFTYVRYLKVVPLTRIINYIKRLIGRASIKQLAK
jgi:hypothetical protein